MNESEVIREFPHSARFLIGVWFQKSSTARMVSNICIKKVKCLFFPFATERIFIRCRQPRTSRVVGIGNELGRIASTNTIVLFFVFMPFMPSDPTTRIQVFFLEIKSIWRICSFLNLFPSSLKKITVLTLFGSLVHFTLLFGLEYLVERFRGVFLLTVTPDFLL